MRHFWLRINTGISKDVAKLSHARENIPQHCVREPRAGHRILKMRDPVICRLIRMSIHAHVFFLASMWDFKVPKRGPLTHGSPFNISASRTKGFNLYSIRGAASSFKIGCVLASRLRV